MTDPTREEMLAFLESQGCEDEFDREEAVFWFAYSWHGGLWSNLYSALSTSPYTPGPIRNGPEDPFWFELLESEYATNAAAAE